MGWNLFDKVLIFRLKYCSDLKYWQALLWQGKHTLLMAGLFCTTFEFVQHIRQDHKMYVIRNSALPVFGGYLQIDIFSWCCQYQCQVYHPFYFLLKYLTFQWINSGSKDFCQNNKHNIKIPSFTAESTTQECNLYIYKKITNKHKTHWFE